MERGGDRVFDWVGIRTDHRVAQGEPARPMVDNLDHAERMCWIANPDDWMRMLRRLRNQMDDCGFEERSRRVLATLLFTGPIKCACVIGMPAGFGCRGWWHRRK